MKDFGKAKAPLVAIVEQTHGLSEGPGGSAGSGTDAAGDSKPLSLPV